MTACLVAFINWKFNKQFGEEMRRSLAIKGGPLGERKLAEMMKDRE